MSAASKYLFSFDSRTNSSVRFGDNIKFARRLCIINAGFQQSNKFSTIAMASKLELKVVTSQNTYIDVTIKSEKDKPNQIQRLKSNGSFNTFTKYDYNVLLVQLRDKNRCNFFKHRLL